MSSLDTNVLVRWLVKDDPRQLIQARHLIRSAVERGELVFVPVTVVLELEWVLRSRYEMSKPVIIQALVSLLETRELAFQCEAAVERAIEHFRRRSADFADCLHLGLSGAEGELPLMTFDRKASRLDGANLVLAPDF